MLKAMNEQAACQKVYSTQRAHDSAGQPLMHSLSCWHASARLYTCRQNPVSNDDGWPLKTGQDWASNHAVDGIDYASIHMWPDNWDRNDLDFGAAWINGHLAQARILGKPLLLEEFGRGFNPIGACHTPTHFHFMGM